MIKIAHVFKTLITNLTSKSTVVLSFLDHILIETLSDKCAAEAKDTWKGTICLPFMTTTTDLMTLLTKIKWTGLHFLYVSAEYLFFLKLELA